MTNDSTAQATTKAPTLDQRLIIMRNNVMDHLQFALMFGLMSLLVIGLCILFMISARNNPDQPLTPIIVLGALAVGELAAMVHYILRTVEDYLRHKELLVEKSSTK